MSVCVVNLLMHWEKPQLRLTFSCMQPKCQPVEEKQKQQTPQEFPCFFFFVPCSNKTESKIGLVFRFTNGRSDLQTGCIMLILNNLSAREVSFVKPSLWAWTHAGVIMNRVSCTSSKMQVCTETSLTPSPVIVLLHGSVPVCISGVILWTMIWQKAAGGRANKI